jgi:16S rRNA pseudouridine516 synthase
MPTPSLAKYLARLGYGSRRACEALLAAGRVSTSTGVVVRDRDVMAHDDLRVDGEPLDPPPASVLLLNKPVGYVCSTSDRPPLIYELLPPRLLHRSPVMAAVGRLDAETSGLLLLTDDGTLNHRLTSPRWHVPKIYEATLTEPLRGDEAERFATGSLQLAGDATPLAPAQLEAVGARTARITIHEGRYHQVRRMFAAIGHHVEALTRVQFGPLTLGTLAPGQWRVLETTEVARLTEKRPAP